MDSRLRRALERGIAERQGRAVGVTASRSVGGGCIHQAIRVDLDDGQAVFVKFNAAAPAGIFEAEAAGLAALAAAGALRVPRGAWPGEVGELRFLVMEAIDEGTRGRGFFERFGRGFARLHRSTAGGRCGFDADNYLGATPQPNPWQRSWVDFFRHQRLGHQLRLAREGGRSDRELDRLGDRLLARLEEWIDLPEEPACLLHGDLWGGNYLVDEAGEPVLVDPACYYGHREADLAMTRLFGGFDSRFWAAYEEEWPLPPGTEERQQLYQLYHLLNHLNLFGGGYRSGCLRILRRFVG